MPLGIYKRTEKYKKEVSERNKRLGILPPSNKGGINKGMLGKHHSEESRKKISEHNVKFFLGKHLSKETRKKISESFKKRYIKEKHPMWGKHRSEETKRKISEKNKGKHIITEEICNKISKANKGKIPWNKGKNKKEYNGLFTMANSKMREKNVNWQGGKSFEPYGLEFNEDLKEVIRNRDRRKCQICEKTELEEGRKLCNHHIDYNKKNNNPNNLISLCRKCHTKTNHNRDYWIKYFIKK